MLKVSGISISYGDNKVVDEVSFNLRRGDIGCLLGPSGCGKTTIMRAIAGFEPVIEGQIELRDIAVANKGFSQPPELRRVAMVFQDFALFPHLTIFENIAFGLQGIDADAKARRVTELLELVGLEGTAQRYPHVLSGGQQQRIALARALAPKPELLLLDEPFSSLDAELREGLAKDVRRIIKQEGATALLVTHDQHEAFATADEIGVMQQGKIHQWGSAYDIYHEPSTRFVADFIGAGVFLPASVTENNTLDTPLGEFAYEGKQGQQPGTRLQLLVRPDDITHDDDSTINAEVINRTFKGSHIMYELQLADQQQVLCLAPSHHDHQVGEKIGIVMDIEHLIVFPVEP